MTVLPYDEQAEEALLDAILLRPNQLATISELLEPADFYVPAHARIFAAAVAIFEAGKPVDYITVHAELRLRGHHKPEDAAELMRLRTPSSSSGSAYARIVKHLAIRRRLMITLDAALDDLEDGEDVAEVAKAASSSSALSDALAWDEGQ